ncbi:asparaginase [Clostridium sp. MB05]|uniref:asparaginase n=1 Tax=Clostridium sp. MB05 TaxID=3376682 RepID=UPI0039824D4B
MKKVAVVFNGGTISMKVDERIKAAVPSLTGEEIMSMVTGIEEFAEVESYSFSSKPSPHMTIQNMLELSKFIKGLVDREDIEGVVLTHGTDTLEETAYFLDLTINTEKVIVVTGAMRSSSELGYDGPFNLATSICTAISEDAKGRGVLVCFNGELNSAAEVTKANSMALNAFRTPNFGPIGIVDNNKVLFYRNTKKYKAYNVDSIEKNVALIKCVAGMDSDYIDYFIEKGYKGIVIEAMGRGNVPPTMLDGIKRALNRNIPVVVVSRCFEGRVYESYGYEGGGKMLKDLGVLFEESMPGQKARIKLLVAISSKKEIDIKDFFQQ